MMMTGLFGENLFDDFFDFRPLSFMPKEKPVRAQLMRTDIKEKEDVYELEVELPGYQKEEVQAQLKDGYLTINASTEKKDEEKDENGKYIRRERFTGSCRRTFYVGKNVEQEDIKAKFDAGVLKIQVPKKPAKQELPENSYIAIEG